MARHVPVCHSGCVPCSRAHHTTGSRPPSAQYARANVEMPSYRLVRKPDRRQSYCPNCGTRATPTAVALQPMLRVTTYGCGTCQHEWRVQRMARAITRSRRRHRRFGDIAEPSSCRRATAARAARRRLSRSTSPATAPASSHRDREASHRTPNPPLAVEAPAAALLIGATGVGVHFDPGGLRNRERRQQHTRRKMIMVCGRNHPMTTPLALP
jgi:hypothetical protein